MSAPPRDLYRILAGRRMCRAYQDRSVPRATLTRILEAARKTPSAGHAQGVRFGVVTAREKRAQIADALGESQYIGRGFPPWFSRAPVHLLVGASSAAYHERYSEADKVTSPDQWPVPYDVLDAGKALMVLYLAAAREGLACGYIGPHRAQSATAVVPWPDDWRFIGLLTVGYADLSQDRPSRSHARGWRDYSSVVQWWDEPGSE